MSEHEKISGDEEDFRDHLSTINEDGKRVWIFPKKPSGKWFNRRQIVSYFLLIVLFATPHIKVGGEQLLLFNILERKFVIFGKVFWPQDFYLFAIAAIIFIIFITLFTVVFGRLFCGWVCPQTIFMEMVFRRIEYWIEGDWTHQKKLKSMPWNREKILKKTSKHLIFWIISFLIANTFLAYIVGSDVLWKIQTDPLDQHIGGFMSIVIFTTVFYLVFAKLREQVCTTICPYGRLQGVLLDENSMVVAYDHKRGEDRAKFKKNEDRAASGKGDCIDCHQCVNVCPTGIDIRHGTQLECVNCTACIDACDHIMDNVGLDKGLIRFVSENGIKNNHGFVWTRRIKAYTALLGVLMILLAVLLITRKDFETEIFKQRGSIFLMTEDGRISNTYTLKLTNKTKKGYTIDLELQGVKNGEIRKMSQRVSLKGEEEIKERFLIVVPYEEFDKGKKVVTIRILGNGKEISTETVKLSGPHI